MSYKIVDGGIFATNIFDKNRFTLTICDIKTFHDLTIKTIGLTQTIKAAHKISHPQIR